MINLRLIVTVKLHQCTSDVSEELLLDDFKSSLHVAVQVDRGLADSLLDKSMEQGRRLRHFAAAQVPAVVWHCRNRVKSHANDLTALENNTIDINHKSRQTTHTHTFTMQIRNAAITQ